MADDTPPSPPEPPTLDGALAARIASRLFGGSEPETTKVGRFHVLCMIGAGGMGEVYLAHDPKLDRNVALKRLREVDPSGRARLEREARALAQLAHPNVVGVYDLVEVDGELQVAMEYVDGTNLGRWQRSQPWRECVKAYIQAGHGLIAAHDAGLLHRDFKPANVLIGSDRRVRVVDFGLAAAIPEPRNAGAPLHEGSQLYGTREYLAPELYAGQPASPQSDQFSYCVAVWEAICGWRPFKPEEIARAGTDAISLEPAGNFSGPAWLRRILQRGLEAQPAARWPDMATLVEHLEHGPRGRRRFMLGGVMSLVLVGWAASLPAADCMVERDLWSHEQQLRFARLARDSNLPYARDTVRAVVEALAGQDDLIEAEQQRICMDRESREFDSVNFCLDQLTKRSAAIREGLTEPEGLANAPSRLAALPDPEICRSPIARDAAEVGPRAAFYRTLLDRGWRFHESGRNHDAVVLANLLVDEPSAPPAIRIDAHLLRGRTQRRLGAIAEARDDFAAATLSGGASTARSRFAAARSLAELEAFDERNPGAAQLPLSIATKTLEEIGMLPALEAELLATRAEVARAIDPVQAIPLLERALALQQGVGASPAKLSVMRLRLANAIADSGSLGPAIAQYEQLLDDQRAWLGPSHPTIATLELNLGITLAEARRWPAAREHLQRALTLESRLKGADSPRLAPILVKLAEVDVELGACTEALSLAERALECRRDDLSPTHPEFLDPLRVEASARLCGERYEDLFEVYRRMLETPPEDPSEAAALHQTAAWTACRIGRHDEARRLAARAQATAEPWLALRVEEVWIELELAEGELTSASERLLATEAGLRAIHDHDHDHDLELAAELAWLRVRIGTALVWPEAVRRTDVQLALRASGYLDAERKNELLGVLEGLQ